MGKPNHLTEESLGNLSFLKDPDHIFALEGSRERHRVLGMGIVAGNTWSQKGQELHILSLPQTHCPFTPTTLNVTIAGVKGDEGKGCSEMDCLCEKKRAEKTDQQGTVF